MQTRNPAVSLTAVFVSSRNALLQQGRYVTRQKRLRGTLVILTVIFSITHFLHTFKPESCPCSASFKIPDPGLYIRKVKNRLYQGPSFGIQKKDVPIPIFISTAYYPFYDRANLLLKCDVDVDILPLYSINKANGNMWICCCYVLVLLLCFYCFMKLLKFVFYKTDSNEKISILRFYACLLVGSFKAN